MMKVCEAHSLTKQKVRTGSTDMSISLVSGFRQLSSDIKQYRESIGRSVGRLSSGARVIRAADDVVSMSVSTGFSSRISSLRVAVRNGNEAISLLQVADDALSQVTSALQRMQALATQSNGGVSNTARGFLDIEFQALKEQVDSILTKTSFNDQKLFIDRVEQRIEVELTGAEFKPSDLDNLQLWLDAQDAETIIDSEGDNANAGAAFSGTVMSWIDKSDNGHVITNGTLSQRPTYSTGNFNGENTVTFDGANDMLRGAVPMSSDELTVFFVVQRTSAVGREFLAEFGPENGRDIIGFQNPTTPVYYNQPGGNWNYGAVAVGTEVIMTTVTDGPALETYLDGTQFLNLPAMGGGDRDPSTSFYLANDSTGGDNFGGHIAEVVAYDRALPDNEREQIEGYLAHRWGLTVNLAGGHPYKNVAPSTGGSTVFVTEGPTERNETLASYDTDILVQPASFNIISGNEEKIFGLDQQGNVVITRPEAIPKAATNYQLKVEIRQGNGTAVQSDVNITIRKEDTIDYQVGDDSDEMLRIDIDEVSLGTLFDTYEIEDLSIATQDDAIIAFEAVQQAIGVVQERRAYIGAMQSRADKAVDSATQRYQALSYSNERIADTDIAEESSNYAMQNVKYQASISIQAQTNTLHAEAVNDMIDPLARLQSG